MNNQTIQNAIVQTGEDLINRLRGISGKQLDTVPFEGSWTAGQVAEHILLSASGIAEMLRGKVTETTRQLEEQVATLQKIFLDYTTKMKSPEFVLPRATVHPKEGLINSLKFAFDSIAASAAALDLSMTCIDSEFPTIGYLTRIELCHFVVFHTQRHIHQLDHIISKLKSVAAAPAI